MAKETKSYKEAVESKAAQDLGDPEPEEEVEPDVSTTSLKEAFDDPETIIRTVPDFLRPDGEDLSGIPDPGGRRSDIEIDLDIGNLDDLSQLGLLQVVARVNIAQLATLFDIADAVEPISSITVSGTNVVDQPGIAVPVVPESDETDIPTKKLTIRASRENKLPIYFGDDDVRPNSGFVLEAGESISLTMDLRGEELYMAAEEAGPQIELLGVL